MVNHKVYYLGDPYNIMEPASSSVSSSPELSRIHTPPPHILLKTKSPHRKACLWTLACLLLLSITVIITLLVLFYTLNLGQKSKASDEWRKSKSSPEDIPHITPNSIPSVQKFLDPLSRFYNDHMSHTELVSPEYVLTAIRTGRPKVTILDTLFRTSDPESQFSSEHIPTSQWFSLDKATAQTEHHKLLHPLQFQNYVRDLGVDSTSHVIVYDHGETHWSFLSATYAWWLFKLYGHSRVSVMRGGLKAWNKMGFQTQKNGVSLPIAGNFTSLWDPDWLATYEDVITHEDSIIDSRLPDQFNGSRHSPGEGYAGHIPHSINLPISLLLDGGGMYKDTKEVLKVLHTSLVDNKLTNKPIVYGNTGLAGSALVFALRANQYPAKLYDGGWIQWSQMTLA